MIRILIVEDEKPISNLIRLSLTKAGYHCTCVYDGNAAVDKLDREIFDLILLDIMLPGIDGFEVCRRIRAMDNKIGIIMLTARTQEMDKVTGLMTGADDYVTKPFSRRSSPPGWMPSTAAPAGIRRACPPTRSATRPSC